MECFLERLGFNSKFLKDKVNDNRLVQKVAIEGLRSNSTRNVDCKN
jgi:hypothetical protein